MESVAVSDGDHGVQLQVHKEEVDLVQLEEDVDHNWEEVDLVQLEEEIVLLLPLWTSHSRWAEQLGAGHTSCDGPPSCPAGSPGG